jgi:hypothetical protein
LAAGAVLLMRTSQRWTDSADLVGTVAALPL